MHWGFQSSSSENNFTGEKYKVWLKERVCESMHHGESLFLVLTKEDMNVDYSKSSQFPKKVELLFPCFAMRHSVVWVRAFLCFSFLCGTEVWIQGLALVSNTLLLQSHS
jgi:hypothetical protein